MIEKHFNEIVLAWILLALILFPVLLFVKAPYGKHSNKKWGPMVNNKTGWVAMEIPALLLFSLLFLSGNVSARTYGWLFFGLWGIHYINRIFIFPLRTRTRGKRIPLVIVIFALFFNLVNGFINGYWLGYLSDGYYTDWLTDPRFITGIIVFIGGFLINHFSDNHLLSLRKGKQNGYYIPTHRLFKYISCPNFAGEILEWTGFAIMTWSLPGLSFAVWTAANLIPRAIHHHKWYKKTFPDYPGNRKAIIPGIL